MRKLLKGEGSKLRSTHFEETDHNSETHVRIKLTKAPVGSKRPKRKSAKATR